MAKKFTTFLTISTKTLKSNKWNTFVIQVELKKLKVPHGNRPPEGGRSRHGHPGHLGCV